MENASKALIIAGAILLSILLISLGIMIFNQAQDTVNNSGMSQAEKATFNNQFLKYEGSQKGSVVKSMINEVLASNADDNHANNGATVDVTTKLKNSNGTLISTNMKAKPTGSEKSIETDGIKTSSTYTIELGYANGRVNKITVTEN